MPTRIKIKRLIGNNKKYFNLIHDFKFLFYSVSIILLYLRSESRWTNCNEILYYNTDEKIDFSLI